jgi:non-ribosomal peptide synthetase component F
LDVSIADLILPLTAGGQVCLLGDLDRTDPERLQRFAAEHRVTWGFVPPSLLPIIDPGQLPDWRVVLTGGEAPGPEQVARWAGDGETPRLRFINGYGPTEATVFAASTKEPALGQVGAGRAAAPTTAPTWWTPSSIRCPSGRPASCSSVARGSRGAT